VPQTVSELLLRRATLGVIHDKGPRSPDCLLYVGSGETMTLATTNTTLLDLGTTTSTSSGPKDFGGLPWVLVEGDCGVDGYCAWSPNHPLQYGNSQTCKLAINDTAAAPLNVQRFDTEYGYDKLTINARDYHGSRGPRGVTPQGSIVWSTDSSVVRPGWNMCMGSKARITTTTTMDFGASPWVVVQGDCGVHGFCTWSPNYPLQYGYLHICTVAVNDAAATPLTVQHFNTEYYYDKLTINGRDYHGRQGPHNVTPQGSIVWSTDESVVQSGWKICMMSTSSTTSTAAVAAATASTTSATSATAAITTTTTAHTHPHLESATCQRKLVSTYLIVLCTLAAKTTMIGW